MHSCCVWSQEIRRISFRWKRKAVQSKQISPLAFYTPGYMEALILRLFALFHTSKKNWDRRTIWPAHYSLWRDGFRIPSIIETYCQVLKTAIRFDDYVKFGNRLPFVLKGGQESEKRTYAYGGVVQNRKKGMRLKQWRFWACVSMDDPYRIFEGSIFFEQSNWLSAQNY